MTVNSQSPNPIVSKLGFSTRESGGGLDVGVDYGTIRNPVTCFADPCVTSIA